MLNAAARHATKHAMIRTRTLGQTFRTRKSTMLSAHRQHLTTKATDAPKNSLLYNIVVLPFKLLGGIFALALGSAGYTYYRLNSSFDSVLSLIPVNKELQSAKERRSDYLSQIHWTSEQRDTLNNLFRDESSQLQRQLQIGCQLSWSMLCLAGGVVTFKKELQEEMKKDGKEIEGLTKLILFVYSIANNFVSQVVDVPREIKLPDIPKNFTNQVSNTLLPIWVDVFNGFIAKKQENVPLLSHTQEEYVMSGEYYGDIVKKL